MSEQNTTKPSGKKFWVVLAILLFLMLLGSGVLNLILGGLLVLAGEGQEDSAYHNLQATVLEGSGPAKILVMNLEGIILDQKSAWEEHADNPETIRAKLQMAAKDDQVKAVVLKVNSPGGTVTASDTIYHTLREFRKSSSKPVVAYFDTLAASGGYYVAMGCNEIVAHPTNITGSIGVIMRFMQAQELLENKLGIHEVVIKSGPNKDMVSLFKPLDPEGRKILDNMVQEMYQRFLAIVQEGRPKLAEDKIKELADGRIYTAGQALQHGLVDQLGYFQDAVAQAKKLGKIEGDCQLVSYQQPKSFMNKLLGASEARATPELELAKIAARRLLQPGLYYLWTE